MNEEQREEWLITAKHEAGHAVMRWLRGLPLTDTHLRIEDGLVHGCVEGTGKLQRADDLLFVSLAGLSAESEYGVLSFDFEKSDTEDLRTARRILDDCEYLRLALPEGFEVGKTKPTIDPVEVALSKWFDECNRQLGAFCYVVEDVADAIIWRGGDLSATALEVILEKYEQN